MLNCDCGDPKIVFRNRSAFYAKLIFDDGVAIGCFEIGANRL